MKKQCICNICGSTFYRYVQENKDISTLCCSKKCQGERYKKLFCKENNPNFKDGTFIKESKCECGNIKDYRSNKCSVCSRKGYQKNVVVCLETLINAVKNSKSYLEVSQKLGHKRSTITRYIKKYNIDISHFAPGRGRHYGEGILCENSKIGNSTIKSLIVRNKLLEYKCSACSLVDKWNGNELVLELDHINGINNDNRIENLRFLCPNCHSQTPTNKGKNSVNKRKPRLTKEKIINSIVRLNELDIPLNSTFMSENHYDIYRAACIKFGNWENAINKSGLCYKDIRIVKKWSKKDIIEEMSIILKQYPKINCSKLAELNGPLYSAIRRHFGNLTKFYKETNNVRT